MACGYTEENLTIGQIQACFNSSCPFHERPKKNEFGHVDDLLMVDPLLEFVSNAVSYNDSFFATLLTTAAHSPYMYPALRRHVSDLYEKASSMYDRYLNMLRIGDEVVQQVFEGLTRINANKRTLFIVVGDHGEAFGENGHWQHGGCVYVPCVWVPLIVHDPLKRLQSDGFNGSGRLTYLSRHADIMPTILYWAGIKVLNSSLDGTALTPGALLHKLAQRCILIIAFFDWRVHSQVCDTGDGGLIVEISSYGHQTIQHISFSPNLVGGMQIMKEEILATDGLCKQVIRYREVVSAAYTSWHTCDFT